MDDHARLANYVFELDPYKIILANGGRSVVMLTHNEPIRIFEILSNFTRERTIASRGGHRRDFVSAGGKV